MSRGCKHRLALGRRRIGFQVEPRGAAHFWQGRDAAGPGVSDGVGTERDHHGVVLWEAAKAAASSLSSGQQQKQMVNPHHLQLFHFRRLAAERHRCGNGHQWDHR